MRKYNFDFAFFYDWYSSYYNRLLNVKRKNPEHECNFEGFASASKSRFYSVCYDLYLSEVLPQGLAEDNTFYEKAFFEAMEKEELPMLSILSAILQEGGEPNRGICPYQKFIQEESYYHLMYKCLDILEHMGTDSPANGTLIFVYDNLLLVHYTQNLEYAYNLSKKLFSLKETESWREHSLGVIYYHTFDLLARTGAGKREFDLLLDFYQRTTLTYIKEEYVADALCAYVKAGLCDENYQWIGGDKTL